MASTVGPVRNPGPVSSSKGFSARLDPQINARLEAGFTGTHGRRILVLTHVPLEQPSSGVVICSPLKAETSRNHRREMIFADELVKRGFAVQRFQYRGTGSSDGGSNEISFETMRDDAVTATEHLMRTAGVSKLAFVGTRLGGLAAAATAAVIARSSPLVLWEPVTDAYRYFREVFRSSLIGNLYSGEAQRDLSIAALFAELEKDGSVDVLGFSIDKPLYESIIERELVQEIGETPRPLLLVQVSRTEGLKSDNETLREHLALLGFDAEAVVVKGDAAWWFAGDWPPRSVEDEPAIPVMTDWLADRLDVEESR